ncbi:hypothetical protein L873DRAFT_1817566, partial [Choiromyces venosus 120613-1]
MSIGELPWCGCACLTKEREKRLISRKSCTPSYLQYRVLSGRANALLTANTTLLRHPRSHRY